MKLQALFAIAAASLAVESVASPPDGATIRELSPMKDHRAGHTATRLLDGSVLVVGGFMEDESEIAGVEVFDPATRQFHAIDNLATPRQGHTATLQQDGRVLFTGGYNARVGKLDSAEVYDPKTGKFAPAGRMSIPRANHNAIALTDGRVVLIGGMGDDWTYLGSIEVYDPRSGEFKVAGHMTVPRGENVSVLLRDGRIFIAGGQPGRGAEKDRFVSSEIFDPRTGKSSAAASMTVAHSDAILLADGRVLLTGGSDERGVRGKYDSAEIYDPIRNTFTPAARMNNGRYKQNRASLLLPNGKALLVGGAQAAELYDPVADTFTSVPSASPLHGYFAAITRLSDRSVLITGGYNRPTSPSNGAWLFEF